MIITTAKTNTPYSPETPVAFATGVSGVSTQILLIIILTQYI